MRISRRPRFMPTRPARRRGKCAERLNELQEQDSIARNATHEGVRASGIPLWATQRFGCRTAELLEEAWL